MSGNGVNQDLRNTSYGLILSSNGLVTCFCVSVGGEQSLALPQFRASSHKSEVVGAPRGDHGDPRDWTQSSRIGIYPVVSSMGRTVDASRWTVLDTETAKSLM